MTRFSRLRPAAGVLTLLVTLMLTTQAQGLCYTVMGVTTCTEWDPSAAKAKGRGAVGGGPAAPPLEKQFPKQQKASSDYEEQPVTATATSTSTPASYAEEPEVQEKKYFEVQPVAPAATEAAYGAWGALGGAGNYDYVVNPNTPEYVDPSPRLPGGQDGSSPEPSQAVCYAMQQGAMIGQAAGMAACGRVMTECSTFQPFASLDGGGPVQTDTPCDNLAMASCKSSAAQSAASNMNCFDFFQTDRDKCTIEEALEIFNNAVNRMCEPLCPDCDEDGGAAAAQEELVEAGINDLMIPDDGEPSLNCLCPPQNEPVCLFEDGSFAARNAPCAMCAGFQADKLILCSDVIQKEDPAINAYDQYAEEGSLGYTEENESVSPSTDAKAGCSATGQPFGLEGCVCDGLAVGEMVGLAACSRVMTECSEFVGFSADEVQPDQQLCDSASKDICVDTSMAMAAQNAQCVQMLQQGTEKCSGQEARAIFRVSVTGMCAPLCPDC